MTNIQRERERERHSKSARIRIDTRQQKIMSRMKAKQKNSLMLEKMNRSVHTHTQCVFLSLSRSFFSGAIVRWSSYIWYVRCSCNRSRKHMWKGKTAGREPVLFQCRLFKKKINTFLLLYTNCELFLHRCCLAFRKPECCCYFSLLHLVQLSSSQCQFHFFGRASKETFEVLLVFFDSNFFCFSTSTSCKVN